MFCYCSFGVSGVSLSARRAWIEICRACCSVRLLVTSLSARRAWIEMLESKQIDPSVMSLSARRAWIEMRVKFGMLPLMYVALRKESVDRNQNCCPYLSSLTVALRKESVDRNNVSTNYHIRVSKVALRKESVDRNLWWGVRKAVGSRRSPQGERG
mgnify:CR=1 FL=1